MTLQLAPFVVAGMQLALYGTITTFMARRSAPQHTVGYINVFNLAATLASTTFWLGAGAPEWYSCSAHLFLTLAMPPLLGALLLARVVNFSRQSAFQTMVVGRLARSPSFLPRLSVVSYHDSRASDGDLDVYSRVTHVIGEEEEEDEEAGRRSSLSGDAELGGRAALQDVDVDSGSEPQDSAPESPTASVIQVGATPSLRPHWKTNHWALLATVLVAIMLPALLLASTIAVSVMTVEAPAVYTATCTDVPYVIISTCFMYCVGVVLCLHCIRRLRSKHVTALQSTVRNELVLVACELAVAWLVHIALVLSGASLVGCTTVTIVMAVVLVATTSVPTLAYQYGVGTWCHPLLLSMARVSGRSGVPSSTNSVLPTHVEGSAQSTNSNGNNNSSNSDSARRSDTVMSCFPCLTRPATVDNTRVAPRGRRSSVWKHAEWLRICSDRIQLRDVLATELGMNLFQQHVRREFSAENLQLFQVVQRYLILNARAHHPQGTSARFVKEVVDDMAMYSSRSSYSGDCESFPPPRDMQRTSIHSTSLVPPKLKRALGTLHAQLASRITPIPPSAAMVISQSAAVHSTTAVPSSRVTDSGGTTTTTSSSSSSTPCAGNSATDKSMVEEAFPDSREADAHSEVGEGTAPSSKADEVRPAAAAVANDEAAVAQEVRAEAEDAANQAADAQNPQLAKQFFLIAKAASIRCPFCQELAMRRLLQPSGVPAKRHSLRTVLATAASPTQAAAATAGSGAGAGAGVGATAVVSGMRLPGSLREVRPLEGIKEQQQHTEGSCPVAAVAAASASSQATAETSSNNSDEPDATSTGDASDSSSGSSSGSKALSSNSFGSTFMASSAIPTVSIPPACSAKEAEQVFSSHNSKRNKARGDASPLAALMQQPSIGGMMRSVGTSETAAGSGFRRGDSALTESPMGDRTPSMVFRTQATPSPAAAAAAGPAVSPSEARPASPPSAVSAAFAGGRVASQVSNFIFSEASRASMFVTAAATAGRNHSLAPTREMEATSAAYLAALQRPIVVTEGFENRCQRFSTLRGDAQERVLQVEAHRIYRQYVRIGAPFQVNLGAALRHRIGHCVMRRMSAAAVLLQAQDDIYRLMARDAYKRFMRTQLFARFCEACVSTNFTVRRPFESHARPGVSTVSPASVHRQSDAHKSQQALMQYRSNAITKLQHGAAGSGVGQVTTQEQLRKPAPPAGAPPVSTQLPGAAHSLKT